MPGIYYQALILGIAVLPTAKKRAKTPFYYTPIPEILQMF